MDIQLFRTFLLVAKLNNITQAAEQLNFTQPTVTAQIQTLEEHFGAALFERIGKKLYHRKNIQCQVDTRTRDKRPWLAT